MGLQQEIKQARPFRPIEEVSLSILRTAVLLENIPNKIFKDAGVTHVQYNVLRILRGSPNGLCRSEIGERLIASVPDVTRLLDRMEASGLIVRHRVEKDRRYVLTKITEKGRQLADSLEVPLVQAFEERLSCVSIEDARTLVSILDKLREQLIERSD